MKTEYVIPSQTPSASLQDEIKNFVLQKNYPCTAAVQSTLRQDYQLHVYDQFGSGRSWAQIRSNLIHFLNTLQMTQSRYLTLWIVFENSENIQTEEEFEKALWHELSCLTSVEDKTTDWPLNQTNDPADPDFCLHLQGEKIFVVGLHPSSSRKARCFSKPALIFNAFSQFEKFKEDGTYNQLVETTRRRDEKFQGSANPMAIAHGENWESIQFSGKKNPSSWKCPFSYFFKKDKPS